MSDECQLAAIGDGLLQRIVEALIARLAAVDWDKLIDLVIQILLSKLLPVLSAKVGVAPA